MKKLVASLLCVGVLGVVSASAQDPSAGPFTTVTEITVTGIADVDSLRFDADNLDVMLARGGANRLELADGDSFRLINGTFQFGGGDGVAVTEDGDGAITFTGEGNGSDENLTWNYDDTANTVVISSSSGVTTLTYTSIGATFGAALSVSSGVVTISDSSAGALDVGGGLNIGTGNVALIGTDGRINGPLSSTIIDDLSGANLTTLNASNLSSGTVATARLGSGTASSSTFLRGDGSWTSVVAGPGGSDTQVQFNVGGALAGDSGFVFDKDANSVDITGTGADALDVGGGLNIGSGNVALVGTDGKISGPLSSTIIDDLSGANLTSLDAGNISSGTLAVARGGTGAASLTDGGLLFGSGTGAVTALGVATNGQIPIGDGGTDPQLATISGTSNEIDITNGSASITVGIPASATITTALTISGTGASSLDIGGGLNAGTGDVALVGDDGRINGPLSSTIIDDLSAANLTSIPAGQLTGSILNARLPTNIDIGGTLDVTGATTLDSTLALVGAVTFNDAGGDVDIRAEGDSVTNLFTLDASTDRIGIGISAPANILHVVQTGADWGMFIDSSSTSYAPGIQLRPNGTTKGWVSATNAGALLLDGNTIVVVNEGSGDKDFRIESDDNANMLVVDGGDDRVGIGKASPTVTLDVDGVTNINGHLNTLAENDLRMQDNTGGQYVGFDAPATVSGSYTMTLPAAIGSVNQMLTINNTDGTLQWATPSTFDTDAAQIFNDSGADVDFRIESDDHQHILFVDGGEDRVGIGTGTPAALLNVKRTVPSIYLTSDGTQQANSGLIRFSEHATGVNDYFEITHNGSDNAFYITSNEAGTVLAIPRDTGNVGIGGVTVPGARLEIEDGGISHPGPLFISRQDDDDVWNMMLVNDSYSTTAVYGVRMTVATDGDFNIYGSDKTSSPGHISFFTDETQRMQIGSNGRLAYNLGDFNNVYGNIEVEGFGDDVGSGMYPDDEDGHQLLNMGAGGGGDAARRGVLKIITTDDGANSSIAMGSVGGADVDFNFFTRRLNGLGAVNLRIKGDGSTEVTGAFSKASGSFKIPHPIWPATHDLVHSFVESSDTLLLYRGTATVDGTETIDLDAYLDLVDDTWDALTRDPQVWVSNASGWEQVRGTVTDGILTLETQDPTATGVEVNWLIAAERQDDHIKETNWTDDDGNPILEPLKPLFSTVAPPTFEESVGGIYPDIEVEDTTPVAPERYPAFRFTDENGNTITEDETDEDII